LKPGKSLFSEGIFTGSAMKSCYPATGQMQTTYRM
jgi:hypothetical protein